MKQTMLAVLASAAIGAAAALYVSTRAPAPRPAPHFDARALELAFARALESAGFGAQARDPHGPAASQGPAPQAPAEAPAPAEAGPADQRADGWSLLPAANRAAIESARPFEEDESLRRTWLFRSERDVIAWLGTPDLVMYEAGGERWHYNRPDGKLQLVAFFARGRLLNIMD